MVDYYSFKKIEELFSREQRQEGRRLLMELQSRCIAMHDTMDSLKTQLREFEGIVFLSKSLHFERSFYWLHQSELRQGPFCPICYEGDNTLLRLAKNNDLWHCPHCHAHFAHGECAGDRAHSAITAPMTAACQTPFGC